LSALEQTLAALFFCGLLAILVWLLRKGRLTAFGLSGTQSQGAGQLDVVARRTLTAQHTLHLVSAAGEIFLVATHPHGVEIASFQVKRKLNRLAADSEEKESN
jgi:flagellar biogenesis protein FliO